MVKFRRLFEKAISKKGPRRLVLPLKGDRAQDVMRRTIQLGQIRRANARMSRKKSNCQPRASNAPLRNNAGASAAGPKAVDFPRLTANFRRNISCAAYPTQSAATKLEARTCRKSPSAKCAAVFQNFVAMPQPKKNPIGSGLSIQRRQTVGIHEEKVTTQIRSGGASLSAVTFRILLRGGLTRQHMRRRFHGNRRIRRTRTLT